MRPMTSRSALSTQTSTWHDWARAILDRLLDDVLDRLHLARARRGTPGRRAPRWPQLPQRQPDSPKPSDTSSCSTRRSSRACSDAARPATRLLAGGRSRRAAARPPRPRAGARPRSRRRARPRGCRSRSGADADVDAAAQPLAQVRVQGRLEPAADAVGRADGEVLERPGPGTRGTRRRRRGAGAAAASASTWPARRRPGRCGRARRSRGAARRTARCGRPARRARTRTCRARCLSTSSTPMRSNSWTTDSSCATAGRRLIDHSAAHRAPAAARPPRGRGPSTRRWPAHAWSPDRIPPLT